ncbi:MAG: hypothetical protein ABEJ22_07585 [Haloferacaceae archaeon]
MSTGTDDADLDSPAHGAALAAAQEAADGTLYSFVAYTPDEFEVLYVDDVMDEFYPSRERMRAHFEEIHSYVHVDFTERNLFEDTLFSDLGTVRTFVTRMDGLTLVRYLDGRNGVFVALDPDECVRDVTRAVESALGGESAESAGDDEKQR